MPDLKITYIIENINKCLLENDLKKLKKILDDIDPDFLMNLKALYCKDNKDPQKGKRNFSCMELNVEITKNCYIKECPNYIDYPHTHNCLLGYLGNTDNRQSLNFNEIAILLKMNYRKVLKIYEKAFSAVQQNPKFIIKALDLEKEEFRQQFEFIKTNKVCCVCESSIDKIKSDLNLPKLGLAYCCKECKQEKPPMNIIVEYSMGITFDTYDKLLSTTYNKSTKRKILSHLKQIRKKDAQ